MSCDYLGGAFSFPNDYSGYTYGQTIAGSRFYVSNDDSSVDVSVSGAFGSSSCDGLVSWWLFEEGSYSPILSGGQPFDGVLGLPAGWYHFSGDQGCDPQAVDVQIDVVGQCVPPPPPDPCAGVVCGACQQCQGGNCVSVCPAGTVCIGGSCQVPPSVDPCTGVQCGPCQACQNGACVDACPAGYVCQNGECVVPVGVGPAPAAAGSSGLVLLLGGIAVAGGAAWVYASRNRQQPGRSAVVAQTGGRRR